MNMPLRPTDYFSRLIVFDIEPVTRRVGAVPLPLPLFAFLNGGEAVTGGGAEDGEEYLHEGMVGVVVAGPFAVHYVREGGFVGAFF